MNLLSKLVPSSPFYLKSEVHFVSSTDGLTLQVHELTDPTVHPSSIRKTHFNKVAHISPDLTADYNVLVFPDGHAKIKGRDDITTVATHLAQLSLLVSPEGNCFQDVSGLEMYTSFQMYYIRWNDQFCWSRYGVELNVQTSTRWGRSKLKYVGPDAGLTHYVVVRKDKYDSLKKGASHSKKESDLQVLLTKKDEELRKVKKELTEANLWKNGASGTNWVKVKEHEKLLTKKDAEIRKVQKEKNEEQAKVTTLHADLLKCKNSNRPTSSKSSGPVPHTTSSARTTKTSRSVNNFTRP